MARPTHGYRTKDGKRVPGVTTIVSKFKDSGGLIHWAWQLGVDGEDYRVKRDDAGSLGTLTHELIEAHIRGQDPWATASPEEMKKAMVGLTAFQGWAQASRLEVVEQETSLVSEEHRFGGTLDALGRVNGELHLLDWKTSNRIYPEYLLQVAAYVALWEEHHPDKEKLCGVHLLRLDKEWGAFHHHAWPRVVIDKAWRGFLLCRELYELQKELKRAVGA